VFGVSGETEMIMAILPLTADINSITSIPSLMANVMGIWLELSAWLHNSVQESAFVFE
jgi:hypothetical protein